LSGRGGEGVPGEELEGAELAEDDVDGAQGEPLQRRVEASDPVRDTATAEGFAEGGIVVGGKGCDVAFSCSARLRRVCGARAPMEATRGVHTPPPRPG